MLSFKEKLKGAAQANQSWLCVGLDPDVSRLPPHLGKEPDSVLKFNQAVIEATSDLVCAYKPNAAFYEALGPGGWEILIETVKLVPGHIPVILDVKRADIGNTAGKYAQSAFEVVGADAVTVNPYMGRDGVEPFTEYKNKATFLLCLTSNPSRIDLQEKILLLDSPPSADDMTPQSKAKTFAEFFSAGTVGLYMHVAHLALEWNHNDNIGLVVGASSPEQLRAVRHEVGDDLPILIPGIGTQGGDLERTVEAGANGSGEMAIFNVSRAIIFAGEGEDFQQKVRQAAVAFKDRLAEAISRKLKYRT